jgi:heavy metal translocating P-type ATPase
MDVSTPPQPASPSSRNANSLPASTTCDYCSAPLPVDFLTTNQTTPFSSGSKVRVYCCYGCRVLGEARPTTGDHRQPAALATIPWVRIGLGVVLASQSMVVGLAVNLSPPHGATRHWLHGVLIISSLGVLWLLGKPLLEASWKCACRRRIGVELLFLAGLSGAFGASLWSTLTQTGAVYYEIVAVLLTVYTAGGALTAQAKEKALSETRRLRDAFSTVRRLRDDGTQEECPVSKIAKGDLTLVHPGEPIVVDGLIRRGDAFVRETPLSGEPHPVVRHVGDSVLAGSYSEDGDLWIEATSSGSNRRLDDLLRTVEAARSDVSGVESQARADRLASWFLPMVLTTSVATMGFWAIRGDWAEGLFNGLAVLLVACPCAIGLATPLAVWNTLATLGSRGFVVRRTSKLETLGTVDTVVFDKTGTLTEETTSLIDFVAEGSSEQRTQWLAWLTAIQTQCPHPISSAFARHPASETSQPPTFQSIDIKRVPASGLEAWIRTSDHQEHFVRVGHERWIQGHANESSLRARLKSVPGDQCVLVEIDRQLVAMGAVRERLRDSTQEAIRQLQDLGLSVGILTGDTHQRAESMLQVPICGNVEIHAQLQPKEKADHLTRLQQAHRRVLYVGDGINDSPALSRADFSLALDTGAPLAAATADAVLCGKDLREIPRAIRDTRQLRQSIQGSLWFAAIYNVLGMLLAATGQLHPVVAALLMVGSSVVVAWRSLRLGADCHPVTVPTVERFRSQQWLQRSLWAASFLVQIPLLSYLGQLRGAEMVLVSLLLLAVAILSDRHRRGARSNVSTARLGFSVNWLEMVLAMLGPGNLGMLAGWWVDAGFGPVLREGVCLCCQSNHYFNLQGRIPWMPIGMLATGMPWMWRGFSRATTRLGRWLAATWVGVSMVFGMSWGADFVLKWAGPMHPNQFLLAFGGMTLGMLLFMGFACALAQSIIPRPDAQYLRG